MKRFLPAIALGLLLLWVNAYLLWEWHAHQISGDVLIHLIFARNFAEGRWFEFAIGQTSRANTTILWEWILAALGLLTGQVQSKEGLLTVARIFATLCTIWAGRNMFRWGRQLGLPESVSAVVCVFVLMNPVTFYWTVLNPMETGVTLLLAVTVARWVWSTARMDATQDWKRGLVGGLWIFLLSLIRPELLAVAGVAALSFLFGQGLARWRVALMVFSIPVVLTLLQAVALHASGVPIVPTPTTARRLMALKYDTIAMPMLNIRINPDAWKFLIAWLPLLLTSLYVAFVGKREDRPTHFLALGVCAFSALFFSLYYYTTWQGRYMLPSLAVLAMPAVAALNRAAILPKPWLLGPAYGLLLCAVVLRPLAVYADGPAERKVVRTFVEPPADARVALVQEVQSSYFYPNLLIISTEGLITPEVHEAYLKGLTVYEFIMELKPDIVAYGRYYLNDPDGLQETINQAAFLGHDVHYKDLHLKFLGDLKGSGPCFTTHFKN